MELFTPSFGLVFWMFVSFALLFLILWKFAWPVIMKSVDERADLIDKGVEYAQQARLQLDNARKSADDIVAAARRKEADIIREADSLKAQIVEEARANAKEVAHKEVEAAKISIEQSRKEAENSLRQQVGVIALNIAQQVLRRQLNDPQAQQALVNSLLDQVENQN
ncbi:MAG: F0F1 ATP synthase subunit B [Muribaculaceae bacterium]|nr:F0F1 ATP synthase subunit B [Muribaculaceae bacterium]MDE6808879.1 F0F1 ATP synthase subunit B [Muribaculaceae bacterium]